MPAEITPLRCEDGALLVLDQRRLPAEEAWVRCDTVEKVADCIRTLAVRGAPAIGLAGAYPSRGVPRVEIALASDASAWPPPPISGKHRCPFSSYRPFVAFSSSLAVSRCFCAIG